MQKVGFLSDDKKLGSLDRQRGKIGPVDTELLPSEHDLLERGLVADAGDVVVVSHARAFGRYRRGFDQREGWLRRLAAMGVAVQIGEDGIAEIYDDAQKRAAFHAAALEPTGEATPIQKRSRGRPSVYREPEGEAREMALEWWAGPLHTNDVCKLIGQMMKTPTPSRPTVVAWLGPRPKHEGRARKPRSDKRN